jgi:hypothetical protein
MFGLVWFAGPIALLCGIIGALAVGQLAIVAGIAGQALSRVIVAVWSGLRPSAQITRSPFWWRFVAALLWSALAVALVSAEMGK